MASIRPEPSGALDNSIAPFIVPAAIEEPPPTLLSLQQVGKQNEARVPTVL